MNNLIQNFIYKIIRPIATQIIQETATISNINIEVLAEYTTLREGRYTGT
jgi:hypothetical protein